MAKKYAKTVTRVTTISDETIETNVFLLNPFFKTVIKIISSSAINVVNQIRFFPISSSGINTINNKDLETKNINEKSSDKYIYKAYLKLNGIDYNSDNFQIDVMAFSLMLQYIYNRAMLKGLNKYDVLRNFDILSFLITCEEIIITDEVKFNFIDNEINGILLDLKDVYKTCSSSQMTYEEIGTDTKRFNEKTLIPAYRIIRDIVERNKDIFMEIS